MLKGTANTVAPILTELFNFFTQLQIWYCASEVENFFGYTNPQVSKILTTIDLSLLPIISKLLKKHVHSIVFEHLEARDLISRDQWGFTLGKSTTTALISTFHDILQLMESGVDVPLILPHLPLLYKLRETNINRHLLQWIADYLYSRQQYAVVGRAASGTTPNIRISSGICLGTSPLPHLHELNNVSSTLQQLKTDSLC